MFKRKLLNPNLGLWIRTDNYILPEINLNNLKNSEIHKKQDLTNWNLVCFKDPTINPYTNCYKYENEYVSIKKGEILKPGLAYWLRVSNLEGNIIDSNLETLNMFKSKNHNNNLVAYSTKKSYYPEDIVDICTSVNKKILNDEVSKKINPILRKVVSTNEGTAHFADVYGYEVGGKTGTAYKVKNGVYTKDKINTFVSLFPISDPKFLLLVLLDEPKPSKEHVYNYRDGRPPYKGNWRNTAGWTTVLIVGNIIENIGPILATKY